MSYQVQTWQAWQTQSFVAGTTQALLTAVSLLIAKLTGWTVNNSGLGYVELRPPSDAGLAADDRLLLVDDSVGLGGGMFLRGNVLSAGSIGALYGRGVGQSFQSGSITTAPWSSGSTSPGLAWHAEALNHDMLLATACGDGLGLFSYEQNQDDWSGLLFGRLMKLPSGDDAEAFLCGSGTVTAFQANHLGYAGAGHDNSLLPHQAVTLSGMSDSACVYFDGTQWREVKRADTYECQLMTRAASQGKWSDINFYETTDDIYAGELRQIRAGRKRGLAFGNEMLADVVIGRRLGNPGGSTAQDELVFDQADG